MGVSAIPAYSSQARPALIDYKDLSAFYFLADSSIAYLVSNGPMLFNIALFSSVRLQATSCHSNTCQAVAETSQSRFDTDLLSNSRLKQLITLFNVFLNHSLE